MPAVMSTTVLHAVHVATRATHGLGSFFIKDQ
jgi:hypothetical protein